MQTETLVLLLAYDRRYTWLFLACCVALYFTIKFLKVWWRRSVLGKWAERTGMTLRAGKDRDFRERYPFQLLPGAYSEGYALNLIDGSASGHDVTLFDYCYRERSSFSHSNSTSKYVRRFSGVICHTSLDLKPLFIRPEMDHPYASMISGFLNLDQDPTQEDIQFESAAFNRRFEVTSDDPAWAQKILSKAAQAWLLEHEDCLIEFHGNMILIQSLGAAFDVPAFERALTLVTGLVDRMEDAARTND